MTEPYDVQRVHRADGPLRSFNDLGVLGAADVHVARRLARLGGESDHAVLLGAALAVRALRLGSVCVDLATVRGSTAVEDVGAEEIEALAWPAPAAWVAALSASPLVADGPAGPADRPLRLVGETLYLDRYWRQEQRIADVLDEAALRPAPPVEGERLAAAVRRLFGAGRDTDRQRLAAVVAAHRWVSVLAGGPGTGKTTTVARLLAVLQDQAGGGLRVALAAPTAVAAARLTAAVGAVDLGPDDRARVGAVQATTLHRLLGWRPGARTRFRHDRGNRLPVDVVVVDEASMVSLTMMARLVDALRADTRLVLVGDPDQLASVEAGAVLGDLVQRPAPAGVVPPAGLAEHAADDLAGLAPDERAAALDRGVVRLSHVHRFSEEIQALAEAVRTGDADAVLRVLDERHDPIEYVDADPALLADLGSVRADVVDAGVGLDAAARAGDADAALVQLARHRLLCAHREGPYGVAGWSDRVEAWLREAVDGYGAEGRWYVGRPLLVTTNDHQLRLYNGDTGVVVAGDRPRAAFRRGSELSLLAPSRLPEVQTVHAMSVHRSQGSQYDRVTLVLPPVESPLLTRELLYTGLTRAKEHVRIIGTREAVAAAVRRPVERASGLRRRA